MGRGTGGVRRGTDALTVTQKNFLARIMVGNPLWRSAVGSRFDPWGLIRNLSPVARSSARVPQSPENRRLQAGVVGDRRPDNRRSLRKILISEFSVGDKVT